MSEQETKDLIQALLHPLNALQLLRDDNPLVVNHYNYPGLPDIINTANNKLKQHIDLVPDWYKDRIVK